MALSRPGAPFDSLIDRTVKQYIGGKQARPDSGDPFPVYGAAGQLLGEAPLGNRKDITTRWKRHGPPRVGQEPPRMPVRR